MNPIDVTLNDYLRLMGLLEYASSKVVMPDLATRLYKILCGARISTQERIDRSIVTMNSRVIVRDIATDREREISVTYPKDAEILDYRVSVLSEIGLGLFGRREKDIVSWPVSRGLGLFEVVSVTYQPEAAGEFHL